MITSADLWNFLCQEKVIGAETKALIGDDSYSLVSEQWLFGEFCNLLLKFQVERGTRVYVNNRNDCENFSRAAHYLMDELHLGSTKKETGVGFGMLWYTKEDGGGHSINFAVVQRTPGWDGMALVFLEPQGPRQIELTEKEKLSCSAISV